MLTDIDKDGADRGRPSVNSHDVLSLGSIKAIGTTSENHVNTQSSASIALQSGFGRLIQTGVIEVVNDGSPTTYAGQSHGLGFYPLMVAALNNTLSSSIPDTLSIILPTFLNLSVGGLVSGAVTFGIYLWAGVGIDTVWVEMNNATGVPTTAYVTYYLYSQQVAPTGE